ncbi:hypothetical protein LNKW23_34470 [Paralimibaculum aggregatum]|uniref:DUF3305 domain-containing protein n=1 Tax=Paralimibaculum aggregatum TaxID=3036245 RepID=A0ABQ6LQH6_9RHOB|nr:DUF3305 domain-containing protein [Limibaculum sp. NKW23]GMG84232.1 hypothetical protein LNKW23_34470 [Limibaculum sp. NKW23]
MSELEKTAVIPLGVVLRKQPGVTRWARWVWRAAAVLPGAGPASWHVMRRDGEAVEYHAATLPLELHRAETEAYRVALSNQPPVVYVVLRPAEEDDTDAPEEMRVHCVTASPFDAQDYLDSGEELVEPVPMPPALIAWVGSFVDRHHVDQPFKKRRRDRVRIDDTEDGRGDPRIRQEADVFRSPAGRRRLQ